MVPYLPCPLSPCFHPLVLTCGAWRSLDACHAKAQVVVIVLCAASSAIGILASRGGVGEADEPACCAEHKLPSPQWPEPASCSRTLSEGAGCGLMQQRRWTQGT